MTLIAHTYVSHLVDGAIIMALAQLHFDPECKGHAPPARKISRSYEVLIAAGYWLM